jgi:hypothetical protein
VTVSVTINLIKYFRETAKKYMRLMRSKNRIMSTYMMTFKEIFRDLQFILKKITGHKTWFYGYNPEAKHQPSQKKSPSSLHVKNVRQVCSSMKGVSIMFFGIHRIVHHEFIPQGQIKNQHFYSNVLWHI